jgi:hypothetical protein
MGRVFIDIAMSLDGYIARPDISPTHPFGVGGEQVYAWHFATETDTDAKLGTDVLQRTEAVLAGSRTYTLSIDDAWGGVNPFRAPVFVLSTHVPEHVADGFTFVTDGIESVFWNTAECRRLADCPAGARPIRVVPPPHGCALSSALPLVEQVAGAEARMLCRPVVNVLKPPARFLRPSIDILPGIGRHGKSAEHRILWKVKDT